MNPAKWPEMICPQPHGPTAREHLESILYMAQRGATSELSLIEKAVEACLGSQCLTKNPPQRGTPPAEHGERVLWALALASSGEWKQCAAALHHGVAPKPSTKQARKP